MAHQADGILLVDKEEGPTSFEVVQRVKRILRIGKAGHAGTLDPFSSGLLIILLGQGTKLSNYIMTEDKVYLATLRLGVETDTLDPKGRVTRVRHVPELTREQIQRKAQCFVGDIEQIPPDYSAVKYMGTRSYKLARKGIKMNLPKRRVKVHSLRILQVDLPDVTMEVECSSGTYIRSLAADLGKELGPGGHVKSLRRLACGPHNARDAIGSQTISRETCGFLQEKIIGLRLALPGMREVELDESLANKVRNGYQPTGEELTANPNGLEKGYVKLLRDGQLVAILKVQGGDRAKIERVFT